MMNIGGVYQKRLDLRDAIYEDLPTHPLDTPTGYFWKLRV
eukprot:SAG11_NODE_41819_length_189_cov_20.233333_1_plen_39_part_01